jgi:hypothetical protein
LPLILFPSPNSLMAAPHGQARLLSGRLSVRETLRLQRPHLEFRIRIQAAAANVLQRCVYGVIRRLGKGGQAMNAGAMREAGNALARR